MLMKVLLENKAQNINWSSKKKDEGWEFHEGQQSEDPTAGPVVFPQLSNQSSTLPQPHN